MSCAPSAAGFAVKVTLDAPGAIVGLDGLNVTAPFVPAGVIVTVVAAGWSSVTVKLEEAAPLLPVVGPVSVAVVGDAAVRESSRLSSKCHTATRFAAVFDVMAGV